MSMLIENSELKVLLEKMPADNRRIVELLAQVLGEYHVANCIKKERRYLHNAQSESSGKNGPLRPSNIFPFQSRKISG